MEQTVTFRRRYLGPGRPGPNRPYEMVEQHQLHLFFQRDEAAIEQPRRLAGWRIYVTNVPPAQMSMSLNQAVAYYRDEWLLEHGFHRFKKGSLPALPLFVRLPERIRGLMLLLIVALQALTLLEFVARRSLDICQQTIVGLMLGNPKMETARLTAERLLAQFTNLHLLVEETATQITGRLVETLTPLQCHILALLEIPDAIYDVVLAQAFLQSKFHDST